MKLAIIDSHDTVLLAWPTVTDAHTDIADQVAEKLHPRRARRRAKTAETIRQHLLELQQQTIRL